MFHFISYWFNVSKTKVVKKSGLKLTISFVCFNDCLVQLLHVLFYLNFSANPIFMEKVLLEEIGEQE